MPSARSTRALRGLARWARSRRSMFTPARCARAGVGASAAAARATTSAAAVGAIKRMVRLLAVRVEHVFETHPLLVEIEVDVARRPVPVLQREELGGPLGALRLVHLLAVQSEHHVG